MLIELQGCPSEFARKSCEREGNVKIAGSLMISQHWILFLLDEKVLLFCELKIYSFFMQDENELMSWFGDGRLKEQKRTSGKFSFV